MKEFTLYSLGLSTPTNFWGGTCKSVNLFNVKALKFLKYY